MKELKYYILPSAALIFLCFLLLDVNTFKALQLSIQNTFIPLWDHQLSSLSLVLTDLGSLSSALIFFVFITVALTIEGRWKEAAVIATTGILTAFLTLVLKEIMFIPRPEEQLRVVDGSRFPSGHASASMAMALSFIYLTVVYTRSIFLRAPLIFIALAFAAVVGTTRLFINVHQPLDIIAGFAIALLSMSFALILSRRLRE
ncbi:MAG: phosphatase PAP2 family protein [Candidatus Paceibacterota bacterium]